MLALSLLCQGSFRGVVGLLRDRFDFPVPLGTAHNVIHAAVAPARRHNAAQDLAAVGLGAHDEIYLAGRPVLVGADVTSTFGCLLSREERCDADTWGVRLLELRASSVVENLNSRLGGCFFLRRHLGPDDLALLQFFLSHRRFLRAGWARVRRSC